MGGKFLRVHSASLPPFVICSSLALIRSPERRREDQSRLLSAQQFAEGLVLSL